MKTSPLNAILLCVGNLLLLVTVFAKPLGIPAEFSALPALPAAICLLIAISRLKKAKAAAPPVRMTDARRKKLFIFMVSVVVVACASGPWVLPFTGITLPFQTLVIISIVSFAVVAPVIWLGLKEQ